MLRRLGLALLSALLVSIVVPAPAAFGQQAAQADPEPEYRSGPELRLELFELFQPGVDPDRDPHNVPDASFPDWSPGDETFRAQVAVQHSAAPELDLLVDVEHNADTGFTLTSANANKLVAWGRLLWDGDLDQRGETDPTLVLELVDHGGPYGWARGLSAELLDEDVEVSPTRWYAFRDGPAMLVVQPGLRSIDELWAEELGRLPDFDESTNDAGTVVRRAVGTTGTDVAGVFGTLSDYPSDEAERVTVTTSSTVDGALESATLDVDLINGDNLRVEIRFFDRGDPIELVEIGDVYRMPGTDVGNDIRADDYDWTGTGASFGPDGESLHEPWTFRGQVRRTDSRRTSLATTAGDLAILAGLDSFSGPDDHEIVRYEYDSRSYVSGLTADFGPPFTSADIDPDTVFLYDLLAVPTHLFPMGLSDEEVWARLGTVPELVTLPGWETDRITTARIPLQVVGRDGFMEWIASESPEEIFTVTVGSSGVGRVERLLIETLDPDGSGLALDIVVHPTAEGSVDLPAKTAIHLLGGSPAASLVLEEDARETFEGTRFEAFFDDTRLAYDSIASQRVPRYLTVIAEPVSRSRKPGAVPIWPNDQIIATGAWLVPGTEIIVGCLSTVNAVGREELTRIWDTFEHGSSLDDRVVQTGAGQYSRVTLYAADDYAGYLGQGPCGWDPQTFG